MTEDRARALLEAIAAGLDANGTLDPDVREAIRVRAAARTAGMFPIDELSRPTGRFVDQLFLEPVAAHPAGLAVEHGEDGAIEVALNAALARGRAHFELAMGLLRDDP